MNEEQTPPLAIGEYARKVSLLARRKLIVRIQQLLPDFLKALARNVFPLYPATVASGETTSEFQAALDRWATDFNVKEPWLLEEVMLTLQGWHANRRFLQDRVWCSQGTDEDLVAADFQFEQPGWNLLKEKWSEFQASIRKNFERELADYEDVARNIAEENGFVRARWKYSLVDFDYFIYYQFGNESSTMIAQRFIAERKLIDESTVLKGIRAVRRMLDWKHLRPVRRRRAAAKPPS